ncbi:uncharacterized protein MELLADRAFT_62294 [Melampsora larici-populina 98AG31]|uniref:Secreted protein n=1 Tax=Melampsora larici-populina (strain 98AG31 / pathotype 3-4-7) TaxID=747676 RepID=F4RIC3_MELLP|nr:uncharacterized protein MELLADRAFT_62294 [Melampsora larici-populina 98AG31]EGG07982.1 hypothetical protein MELLADRAFT_62294 [Melampsora larici-populina 98AG31]
MKLLYSMSFIFLFSSTQFVLIDGMEVFHHPSTNAAVNQIYDYIKLNIDHLNLDPAHHLEDDKHGKRGFNLPTHTSHYPDCPDKVGSYYPWHETIPNSDSQDFDSPEALDSSLYYENSHDIHMSSLTQKYQDSVNIPQYMVNPEHETFQHTIPFNHEKPSHPYSFHPLENQYQSIIDPKHINSNFVFENVHEHNTFGPSIHLDHESDGSFDHQTFLHQSQTNSVHRNQDVDSQHDLGYDNSADSIYQHRLSPSGSNPEVTNFAKSQPTSFQRLVKKSKSAKGGPMSDIEDFVNSFPQTSHKSLKTFFETRKSRRMDPISSQRKFINLD